MCDRIIVLVDMDCFYCQVEARYNPTLQGKPVAVVQYNQWQGGGIIAVNYEARAFGVTRHIRGNEAKKKCPEIILVHVPSVRGKADLTRYREAGREVVDVLCQFCDTVQRASVDEAYLDITNAVDMRYKELKGAAVKPEQLLNTFIVGCSAEDVNDEDEREKGLSTWLNRVYRSELRDETAEKLTVAALLVEEMRAAVYASTGFRCSAGIAHNKILAKLACGLHKPQRQTILPQSGVNILYRTLPLKKIRGLGGKFGDVVMKRLNVTYMSELTQFSETHLQKKFDEKSGSWLYNIAQGFDDEAVTARLTSKSIGCCKKFPGKLALNTKETVEHWLSELSEEVAERLEKELLEGNRKATQFVVSYMQRIDGRDISSSRCGALTSYEPKLIVQDAMELLKRSNTAPGDSSSWFPPLNFLGLSTGKFTEKDSRNSKIENFFKTAPKRNDRGSFKKDPTIEKADDLDSFKNDQAIKKTDLDSFQNDQTIKKTDDLDSFKNDQTMKKLDDLNSFNNDQNAIENVSEKQYQLPSTPENMCKEEKNSKSSAKNSFFIKFFKQEGLIRTPSSHNSENEPQEKNENELEESKKNRLVKGPTGTSQQPTTSEGHTGITNKALRLVQVDESSNDSEKPVENWVSPCEIFPDLDEVDDDVAALLPSPLQRQLRFRILKYRESRNHRKNKGYGKGKCHKSLKYDKQTESELEDDPQPLPNNFIVDSEDRKELSSKEEKHETNENQQKCISPEDIFASDSSSELKTKSHTEDTHSNTSKMEESETSKRDDSTENLNKDESEDVVQCNIPLSQDSYGAPMECASSNTSNNGKGSSEFGEIVKELCPHCNQLISLQEYPEHLDFHVAADLDKEINKAPSSHSFSKSVVQGKSPQKDGFGKRKRGRPAQKQAPPSADKKIRSITNFFAPVR